jgi:predicted GNAT family acetyltransferase
MHPDELSAGAAPPGAVAGMGAGFPLVQEFWPEQTPEGWQEAREEGFQYCAVIEHGQLQAMAAVWRYSEATWEVASVYTRPEARGHGYAQAVVSFVTAAILNAGKRATCSAASDNPAMQRVAESVGFQRTT